MLLYLEENKLIKLAQKTVAEAALYTTYVW